MRDWRSKEERTLPMMPGSGYLARISLYSSYRKEERMAMYSCLKFWTACGQRMRNNGRGSGWGMLVPHRAAYWPEWACWRQLLMNAL